VESAYGGRKATHRIMTLRIGNSGDNCAEKSFEDVDKMSMRERETDRQTHRETIFVSIRFSSFKSVSFVYYKRRCLR
jgi:hypothetical protein